MSGHDNKISGKGCGRGLRGEERGGRGRGWKRAAHIERVYASVELLDTDILHCAAPLYAIEDHLLRLGRIVSAGFQEAPISPRARGKSKAGVKQGTGTGVDMGSHIVNKSQVGECEGVWGTNVRVWSSFGMGLSA
jgi:hypothetical protein